MITKKGGQAIDTIPLNQPHIQQQQILKYTKNKLNKQYEQEKKITQSHSSQTQSLFSLHYLKPIGISKPLCLSRKKKQQLWWATWQLNWYAFPNHNLADGWIAERFLFWIHHVHMSS